MSSRIVSILLVVLGLSSAIQAQEVLGHRTLQLTDPVRHKTFTADLWYPATPGAKSTEVTGFYVQAARAENAPPAAGRRGLIVLSHGLNGKPGGLAWLAEGLVAAGFVVAAPQHLDPTFKAIHMNHWNRAEDIRFLITYLLKSDAGIDPRRIGMAGFSLGGGTGIFLAGGRATQWRRTANPGPKWAPADEFPPVDSENYKKLMTTTDFQVAAADHSDPRIRSFYLMAPSLGWAWDKKDLAGIQRPIRIVVGDQDEMLVPATNALFYADAIPGAELWRIPAPAGHYIFHARIQPAQEKNFDPDGYLRSVYTDPAGVDRAALQKRIATDACQFFRKTLK